MDERPVLRTSRRALLAAAGGAAAALAAESLARPLPAAATDNMPLIVGQANQATKETSLQVEYPRAQGMNAFAVRTVGMPCAVLAEAAGGDAMRASGTGVNGRGIWAYGEEDYGVHGVSGSGVGVHGQGDAPGWAFMSTGRVGFSTSGLGTVPIGKNRAIIGPPQLTAGTIDQYARVLITLMSNPKGVQVSHVQIYPASGRFAVFLTANAKVDTRFAYFVISGG